MSSILSFFRRKADLIDENALLIQRCAELKADRDASAMREDAWRTWRDLARQEYATLLHKYDSLTVAYEDLINLPDGMPCEQR